MLIFNIYFLAVLGIIGAIVSYDDIKFKRVRNKFILAGFLSGSFGYLLLLAYALISHRIKIVYFTDLSINVLISWSIALLIWYCGFWAAGDAKLFMLFSFLFPLEFYGNNHGPLYFFPSFILLVNTFIFVLAFVFIEVFFRIAELAVSCLSRRDECIGNLKKKIVDLKARAMQLTVNKGEFAKIILAFFSFFLAMNIFMMHLEYVKNEAIRNFPVLKALKDFSFLIFILIFRPLRKFLGKVRMKILCFIAAFLAVYTVAIVVFYSKAYMSQLARMFINFTGIMLFVFLAARAIEMYIEYKEELSMDTKDVSPGLKLTSESAGKMNAYFKEQGIREKFYSDGLTSQQAQLLKEASLKKPELAQVSIYKSFPLAPFIFLGVIVTAVKKDLVFDLHSFRSVINMIVGRFF
jgi:hypothetical protein